MRKPYNVYEGKKQIAACKDKREAITFIRTNFKLAHALPYSRSSFAPVKTIDGRVIYFCKSL